jgi:hypothetical protein
MASHGHAELGPSAAARWISCPASVALVATEADEESVYAAEGTAAHTLAELELLWAYSTDLTLEDYKERERIWHDDALQHEYDVDEMRLHVRHYVDLVGRALQQDPHSALLVEARLDTGIPNCWGTGDAVIVTPTKIRVIDLKYGKGVAVLADESEQLKLYGLAALRTFDGLIGDFDEVTVTIYQPRNGGESNGSFKPVELERWAAKVVEPAAKAALADDGTAWFGPSEKACRWCAMSGRCKAQLEEVFGVADFETDPTTLTPEEQSEVLAKVKFVRGWLTAFEEQALRTVWDQGKVIPGYKVVMSGGKRAFTDARGAVTALREAFRADLVREAPETIGVLEKELGKEFDELLGHFIAKGKGKPSLVTEDDPRPPVSSNAEAAREFAEVLENEKCH